MIDENERDLRIAAFLDGAMNEEDCAAFERELESDPALANELERLSANDDLLREAMAIDEASSIDDAFVARMGLAATDGTSTLHVIDQAKSLPANDNPPFWNRWDVRAGAAIAATLVLALTFTFPNSGQSSGFADALDQTPSGQMAALDDDATITPILTFETGDGRFCREFKFETAGASSSGIACRAAGEWAVEAWSDDAVEIPDSNEIALAGGAGPEALDNAYLRLDAGDPFSVERERQIIENAWAAE